jgi:hypothetical protein
MHNAARVIFQSHLIVMWSLTRLELSFNNISRSGEMAGFLLDSGSFCKSNRKSRSYFLFPSGFNGLHWPGKQIWHHPICQTLFEQHYESRIKHLRNEEFHIVSSWNIWNTFHHWHSVLNITQTHSRTISILSWNQHKRAGFQSRVFAFSNRQTVFK